MTEIDYQGAFKQAGFGRLDTPILQPADVFLDRSGDAIRRRLFMLTDPVGREFCLRPELTTPILLEVIAQGCKPARVWSDGKIFRFGSEEGNESWQAGVECLGGTAPVSDEVEVFSLVQSVCAAGGAVDITMGDLGILDSVLAVVDLPANWRARLRRHFWHADVFQDLLSRLKGEAPAAADDENSGLLKSIGALSQEEAVKAVHDILKLANISPVGGRSVEEITARFLEKAQDADEDIVAPEAAAATEDFLSVKTTVAKAADDLAVVAKKHGAMIDPALERLSARHEALAKAGLELDTALFATAFGRELEYYTGFVFELHQGGRKVAGGGRYDGLARQLGAAADMTAIGAAIWPHRLGGGA